VKNISRVLCAVDIDEPGRAAFAQALALARAHAAKHGEAGATILLHARARQPDLIVLSAAHGMGAHGRRSPPVASPKQLFKSCRR
jgi:hypothetical protein